MRWIRVLVLLAVGGLALGQDDAPRETEEPGATRLHLDVDPHGLSKELARVDSYARGGKNEDAVALVDRPLGDPRARDGLQIAKPGAGKAKILTSFERALRTRILALPPATQRAFDARFDDD